MSIYTLSIYTRLSDFPKITRLPQGYPTSPKLPKVTRLPKGYPYPMMSNLLNLLREHT